MSNDQLSWDQLLQNNTADQINRDNKVEPKSLDSAPVMSSPQAQAEAPTEVSSTAVAENPVKTKKRAAGQSSKKAANKVQEPSEPQPLYAKKDWSKLEFPTTENKAPEVSAANTAVAEVKETKVAVELEKTTIKAVSSSRAATAKKRSPPKYEDDPFGFEDEGPEQEQKEKEPQVLTVSELNKNIRDILEGRFALVWIKGEISNFKAHTSGHFYFSLKDSKAQVSAVMFRGFNSQLRFRPEDGMEVLIRGKITVYEPRGNYQIFCEVMEPVGAGALQKAFEQLKAKLQKEGLFEEARKRPLPSLPRHIAIVTSPTGAAIRDMLNVLGRRFKGVNITVIPCKVQGDQAPGEIVAAIALANRLPDVDVMIVGRGGGSIEDLWAFNEEKVARAIASARVPVISAVGHEIDFTIADFVADLRAPTPSAAAELVVKNAADLTERVAGLARALKLSLLGFLNSARQQVSQVSKRLVDPQRRIQDASLRCDELLQRLESAALRNFQNGLLQIQLLEKRLGTPLPMITSERQNVVNLDRRMRSSMRNLLERKRELVAKNAAVMDSLSPLKVLDRGYSMVVADEQIVTDATDLKAGQMVTVRMCKGSIEAQVVNIKEDKKKTK